MVAEPCWVALALACFRGFVLEYRSRSRTCLAALRDVLLQAPNSYFMDVRCMGCMNITTVFSHATNVVVCGSCAIVLCQPTGGKARLTEGCSFRRKQD